MERRRGALWSVVGGHGVLGCGWKVETTTAVPWLTWRIYGSSRMALIEEEKCPPTCF